MKINKVLSVVIPIMILGGCGGIDKTSTEKQDGTFEPYAKGKYPSKDDFVSGT